ncbi:20156_t:CDS:2 [Funneliformis geosporum]|uniref:17229_t:CDS:1 n=1 Tax=Funneliformis geosporum TaxID=1117311 RepID=A0A9W4WHB0_9GLOM|nr:17229_t:CDS:2 [Funneliformis geosporum]CAI2163009.1 20156_t:CDS:2 [Funneliformis geosporum]
MNNDYSWDERIDDFMSIFHNDSVPTKKIFLNLSFLSTLVIIFFLENGEENITKQDDIFTEIKVRSKHLISQEIIDTKIDEQIRNFQPIKELLLEYLVTQKDKRSILITNLVKECNLFFENLLKSENIFHLIPFTITFAIVHLTVMRTSLKLNTSSVDEVKEIISRYQSHFKDSFHQFFTWRMDQITTKTTISNDSSSSSLFTFRANGEVRDTISNKLVNYVAKSSNDQIFLKVFDLIKLRMLNETKTEFMKMFLHIFSLVNSFPDIESLHIMSWPLNVRSFWVGPYGIDTFPDGLHNLEDNSKLFYNIFDDDPGIIRKIVVRHYGIIDRIQAYYDDDDPDNENYRAGKSIGTGTGGSECIISDLDNFSKYVVAINITFGYGLLAAIEFTFNNGKSTGILGRVPKKQKIGTLQIGPFGKYNEFRLSGISGGGGKVIRDNEDFGENAAHIAFQFQYVDSL